MEKLKKFMRVNCWSMLASVIVPILVLAWVYFQQGIYLGSETTLLASDAFAQFSNFYASFNNMLHGKQDIFYTWYGSLGLNYWALMSYYLNGVFTPIVFFFDNLHIPDAMYVITLLKFGCMGLSFFIFAHYTFKVPQWIKVGLSVSYALMSYGIAYSPMIMWLDALIYLPLIVLGIHRLMDKKKPTLLFISYLFLFLSNFYMAFMVGIFTFLYFFARSFTKWGQYKKSISMYLITSILAGCTSMITILPTIFDLSNNGEGLTEINRWITPDVGTWDMVVKSMSAVYDTSKYEAAPFFYVGILPLLFCLFYFVTKRVLLQEKIIYGSLGIFLVASIYIQPLNLFWHGLHSPNMFLFRFSFLFSFFILLFAGYGIEKMEKQELNRLVNIGIVLLVIFTSAYIFSNKKRYDYITRESLILSLFFLAVYVGLCVVYYTKINYRKFLPAVVLIIVGIELVFNAQAMIAGVRKDWNYPKRELYTEYYQDIKTLTDETHSLTPGFYRMANVDPISHNESFNYGYSGVSMFSSIRNRHSSSYMNQLGFRSTGTNLNIDYKNNTILMDALLGIKYNIGRESPMKYGFNNIKNSGSYDLYENQYVLPLGILTDKGIYKKEAFQNQESLIKHLAESKQPLFYFKEPKEVNKENLIVQQEGDILYLSEEKPSADKIMTWSVDVPAHSQAYLNLLVENSGAMRDAVAEVTVNGISRASDMPRTGQYYNLGYYEKATTITVKVAFRGVSVVKMLRPDTLILNTENFKSMIQSAQRKGVEFEGKGRKLKTSINSTKENVLFTTIPYDSGWKAYLDGKEVPIKAVEEAFLAVTVPAGEHELSLVFLPQGFTIGASLFVICPILFLLFVWSQSRKK
ncbi:hypothetical protein A5821_002130 [Enterococcus sp. 7F3_DIV0205]|uniref:ABC transporter permease n=1 Tax=Candidatus Enterococcus palustris TaxID=1834189 RepID=A0AAQ3W985_9ENTE|nr:YfhO family protein [Enterococcus sp. 7F3_DIV0205]OTN82569.1 hypothetical protein A5821_002480 [Enterococcus sp. 7F3_DIV0205]